MNFWFQFIFRTVVIVACSLIALRLFVMFVQRIPGLFVGLSALALCGLAFAMYKGSFKAVGLHNRKAVALAMTAAFIVLIISAAILILVK